VRVCCLRLQTRRSGRFHRGSWRVEQDNSNGSCKRLENATGYELPGKSFWSHDTQIFIRYIAYKDNCCRLSFAPKPLRCNIIASYQPYSPPECLATESLETAFFGK